MKKTILGKLSKRATNVLLALFMALWQLAMPVLMTRPVGATNIPGPNDVSYWCANYDGGVKFDDPDPDDTDTDEGISVYFSQNEKEVDVTAVDDDLVVKKVIVKAGSNGGDDGLGNEIYTTPPFENLLAPLNTNTPSPTDTREISHVIVCYDEIEPGSIKIIKDAQPNSTNDFDFTVKKGSSTVDTFELEDDGDENDSQKNNETVNNLSAGVYVVTEIPEVAGWSVTDITCSDGTVFVKDVANKKVTITLGESQNVTCTFVNKKLGKVKLIKAVTNNNGGNLGANDFGLTINGQSVTSGQEVEFGAGTQVAINEAGANGYEFVSITGEGCPAQLGGNVTVVANQTVTCTITNDDVAPWLEVAKRVINDNGGTMHSGDFDLFVNGQQIDNPKRGGGDDSDNTTFHHYEDAAANVEYTVSETQVNGYQASDVECVYYGTDTVVPHPVTLELGEHVVCTITNDDKPGTLILEKLLPNDNGGDATIDDFQVFINGQLSSWGQHTVDAGDYVVSESTLSGYLPSGWSVDCDTDGNVTVGLGETKTCQITNDDVAPKLTLKKVVVNDNGGEAESKDWTLTATPEAGSVLSGNGEDGFEDKDALSHTTYTLSEDGPYGYEAGEWECYSTAGVFSHPNGDKDEIRMSEGADVTCTITNDDKSPKVIVKKYTQYDSEQEFGFSLYNEGQLHADFGMTTGGKYTADNLQAGEIKVVENDTEGWYLDWADCYYWAWDGDYKYRQSVGTEFEAENGRKYICEFYNERKAEVEVVKDAKPNHAQDFHFTVEREELECELSFVLTQIDNRLDDCGPELHDEFDLDDDSDATLSSSKSQYVLPGFYTVTEDPTAGWTLKDIACGDIQVVDQTDNSITFYVGAGEKVSCTFTNLKDEVPEEPQVLGEVTPEAPQVLAFTGEGYDIRGAMFGGTIIIGVAGTSLLRRKEKTQD